MPPPGQGPLVAAGDPPANAPAMVAAITEARRRIRRRLPSPVAPTGVDVVNYRAVFPKRSLRITEKRVMKAAETASDESNPLSPVALQPQPDLLRRRLTQAGGDLAVHAGVDLRLHLGEEALAIPGTGPIGVCAQPLADQGQLPCDLVGAPEVGQAEPSRA